MEVTDIRISRGSLSEEYNTFLGKISSRLVRLSPPANQNFLVRSSIMNNAPMIEIWFRTRGCHYFLQGGCTMCNYGFGPKVLADDMVEYVRQALATVKTDERTYLLISPSGNMLDDWEVPQEAREGIWRLIAGLPWALYLCESQAKYITDDRIGRMSDILKHRPTQISIGLESANPWILHFSINKDLPLDQYGQAVQVLKRHHVLCNANIILGAPFLTPKEAIEDSVNATRWAFEQGTDECFVLPINVKRGTLVQWLWERKMYSAPSLWSLVEVLHRLGAELASRTGTAWYKTYYKENKALQAKYLRSPQTCPKCQDWVIQQLDSFLVSRDFAIIQELNEFNCHCKDDWHAQLDSSEGLSLKERVAATYTLLGQEILGREWWTQNGEKVLQEVYNS